MKYVVILGDGMSDYPIEKLGNKTPLEVANTPFMDFLASKGEVGLFKTVPDSLKPGSDVANLSVLGVNVENAYTGRSPLEGASIGVTLGDNDLSARVNLVTLSDEPEFSEKTLIDYSAGEISTEDAEVLINYLKKHLDDEKHTLYSGVSYRHCLVVKNGKPLNTTTPAHDITGRKIKDYLPEQVYGNCYIELMERANSLLRLHPINVKRRQEGVNPANGIWIWGEGTKPNLENFTKKTGLKGGMISAVDLLRGIAILSGMKVIKVDGITGNYDTNFLGKAKACVDALDDLDFVYLHIEAPDECGHHGDVDKKIYSIEQVDGVIKSVYEGLKQKGEDFAILVCPDHPTPICTKTHARDPVPYIIYRSDKKVSGVNEFNEKTAQGTGNYTEKGYTLIEKLING